jgi:tRNA dimethylallyltransferase
MNNELLPPLVLIAGPTASGKSALAVALADLTPATIINADSMQVYADLRLITARPSPEDEALHPHALFGHRDGADPYSAAQWAKDTENAIALAHLEKRLPVLVGGSGLYIRTLLDGIAPVPEIDADIRATVRALPVDEAYAALEQVDPDMALRLRPQDTTRVARALEVKRSTGQSLIYWQGKQEHVGLKTKVRVIPIVLAPEIEALEPRIEMRLDQMLDEGRDEVRTLLARNLDPRLPVMRAIGVPEIGAFLSREMSRSEARKAMLLATRQYAKRQRTWFRQQAPKGWWRFHESLNAEKCQELVTILATDALTQ